MSIMSNLAVVIFTDTEFVGDWTLAGKIGFYLVLEVGYARLRSCVLEGHSMLMA